MQHLNLAQQIVHTMAHAKTRAANNVAAAYSSHHFRIFYANEDYLAAMSTANAHLIRAHRFVVNENHATINERLSSCYYDECIYAGSRHMMQDHLNALIGHFIVILMAAWLIFPNPTKHAGSYFISINQSRPSRLPRLMHAPMTAYVSSRDRTVTFQRRSTYCDISSLGYSWS